jgi:hypothetical protein
VKFEGNLGKAARLSCDGPIRNAWLPQGSTRRLSGVSLGSIGVWYPVFMNRNTHHRVRSAAAWICMLAVGLLYAPMAGAALVAYGVDCCMGGFCNIPEHHHHKSQPTPAQDTASMDCGHDMSGMTSCSMSCCKDPARPALIPGAFVLPAANFVPADSGVIRPIMLTNRLEISRFVKPLSPPPRFISSVL